jgi:two-component system, cell cycle sensor histidine kinase and response regulator CckA
MSFSSQIAHLPSLIEVMNRSPLTVSPDLSVETAITLISQAEGKHCNLLISDATAPVKLSNLHQHSFVLVTKGMQLRGILTERDIVRLTAAQTDLTNISVGEVMTRQLVTLTQSSSQTAMTALSLFYQHRIRHLPIVDEGGDLVGIVTPDLIRQILQPVNLLKLRSIEEVMTAPVIHAPATASVLSIARQMATHRVSCVVITAETPEDRDLEPAVLQPIGMIAERDIVQFQTLGIDFAQTQARTVMSSPVFSLQPQESMWRAQQEMQSRCIRRLVITGGSGQLLGIVTQTSLLQVLDPMEVLGTIDILQQQVQMQTTALQQTNQELRQSEAKLRQANDRLAQTVVDRTGELSQSDRQYRQSEATLQQQVERHRLMMGIAQRIRQSLNLPDILQTTVDEVRQFLQTDRVLMLQFEPDFSGTVAVESVGSSWNAILASWIQDPCIAEQYLEPFRRGQITVKHDIYTDNIDPCHLELLASFQVRANLVVPILQGETLWGLLIAHHCEAPRYWQPLEIDLLRQLAMQVGIAIEQARLFDQVQSELSERQQAEASLIAKTTEFEELYHHAPCGYHSLDRDGRYISINDTELTMLGYTREEVVGKKTFDELLTPESLQTAQANFPPFQLDDVEVQMVRKDGTILPVSVSSRMVDDRDGNYLMNRSVVLDIRERVRIRAERKQAAQKIQEQAALIDIATDAIFVCDLDRRIIFWNQGAERLYGWQAAEVMGVDAVEIIRPQETDFIAPAYQTLLAQNAWEGEIQTQTKADRPISVTSRWTLMRDEAGQVKSILVVNTDITEKKQLAAQFLRAQRLESLGTLASGIAHDMNNVLTPILAASQLLPLRLPNVDERSQSLLRILEESAKRGTDLVQQILSFARGSDGTRTLVQIRYTLSEVVQVARQTFPKSIEISLNLATTDLWMVSADATQLHQVLMNLTINARDAMPDGGTLTLAAENLVLDETYARMNIDARIGPYVMVTVADTGTGIPPEILAQIFDPFFTTKVPGQGTGLGLSTTLGIVKSHGGFVSTHSEVGRGTQFKIYLPAAANSETEIATGSLDLPIGNGELVLVVDDEVSVREIIKASLEAYNYQVVTASDGIEAIAIYAQLQAEIEVVLLDLMMPSLDSASTIHALQRINGDVSIVVMSGLSTNDPITDTSDLNVQAFLAKPFTSQELLQILHRLKVSEI